MNLFELDCFFLSTDHHDQRIGKKYSEYVRSIPFDVGVNIILRVSNQIRLLWVVSWGGSLLYSGFVVLANH